MKHIFGALIIALSTQNLPRLHVQQLLKSSRVGIQQNFKAKIAGDVVSLIVNPIAQVSKGLLRDIFFTSLKSRIEHEKIAYPHSKNVICSKRD